MKRPIPTPPWLTTWLVLFLLAAPNVSGGAEGWARKVEVNRERPFRTPPVIEGFQGASAVLAFETVRPAPAARVHYGVLSSHGDLAAPLYRKVAVEIPPKGKVRWREHRILLPLDALERPAYDTRIVQDGGGTIAYRVELLEPEAARGRFVDGRFRYRRTGPPGSGPYETATALTAGPFLDRVTPDGAVISWETDRPAAGAVEVDGKRVAAPGAARRHEVAVSGLAPDTRHVYRVRYGEDGVSDGFRLRTAPLPGSRSPFRFGFVSDSRGGLGGGERGMDGTNVSVLGRFMNRLYVQGADFVCFGGDLVDGYTSDPLTLASQFDTWKRAVQPAAAHMPVYEAMGNHEQVGDYFRAPDPGHPGKEMLIFADRPDPESAEAWFARSFVNPEGSAYGFGPPRPEARRPGLGGARTGPGYAETVYSFRYGNVHFVVLNTNYWATGVSGRGGKGTVRGWADKPGNDEALRRLGGNREGYLRENQLAWLRRDLGRAREDSGVDWVIVVMHEPAFPNGGHVADGLYWGTPGHGERGGYQDERAPLGDVMAMRGRFLDILSEHPKVLAVLVGDEHNYSRTRVDEALHEGVREPFWQITSGGCGAPYYLQDRSVPWAENVVRFAPAFHSCLFSVDGPRVSLTVHGEDGEVLDRVEDLAAVRSRTEGKPAAPTPADAPEAPPGAPPRETMERPCSPDSRHCGPPGPVREDRGASGPLFRHPPSPG